MEDASEVSGVFDLIILDEIGGFEKFRNYLNKNGIIITFSLSQHIHPILTPQSWLIRTNTIQSVVAPTGHTNVLIIKKLQD